MTQRLTRKNTAPIDSPRSPSPAEIQSLVVSNREVLRSIQSLKEDFNSMRSCVSSLEARIVGFEQTLSTLRESQKKCETDIVNIKSDFEQLKLSLSSSNSEILQEVEERQLRRNNVMIFGLPETSHGSLTERKDHDNRAIHELFETIGIQNVSTEETRRVGRITDDKIRALKVTLKDVNTKRKILRSAKELRKSSRFRHVFLANDATKWQQKELFYLRSELKKRRDLGEDVVIYNGQLRSKESLQNFRV